MILKIQKKVAKETAGIMMGIKKIYMNMDYGRF